MNYQSAREELIEEEVAFWHGFIEWLGQERVAPVPPRAWEALAWAEAKRQLPRSSFAEDAVDRK